MLYLKWNKAVKYDVKTVACPVKAVNWGTLCDNMVRTCAVSTWLSVDLTWYSIWAQFQQQLLVNIQNFLYGVKFRTWPGSRQFWKLSMVGFLQGQKTSGKKLWNIGGNEVGMGWVHCGVVAAMRLWSISNECNSSCPLSLPETVVWCLVGASRAWHGCWCHGTAMVPPVTSSIGGQQVSWDLTTQWKWTHIFFGNKSVPLIPESIYVVDCYDQHIIRQTKYFDWLGQPLVSVEFAFWLVDLCFGGWGHLMTMEGRMEAKSHGFPWLLPWLQSPLANFQIWSHFLRLACADARSAYWHRQGAFLEIRFSNNVKVSFQQTPYTFSL